MYKNKTEKYLDILYEIEDYFAYESITISEAIDYFQKRLER